MNKNSEELTDMLQSQRELTSLRVNLLTFSFTTVVAVIGIAFANLDKNVPSLLYFLPYFLIIPFSARITYYRMNSAHRGSFLQVFYPESVKFSRGQIFVRERQRQSFRLISALVNTEMLVLGFACNALFFISQQGKLLTAPMILSGLPPFVVGVIIYQGYNYGKIKLRFLHKWKLAKELFGSNLEKEVLPPNEVFYPILEKLNILRGSSKKLYCDESSFECSRNTFFMYLIVLEDDKYLSFDECESGNFEIKFKVKFLFAAQRNTFLRSRCRTSPRKGFTKKRDGYSNAAVIYARGGVQNPDPARSSEIEDKYI